MMKNNQHFALVALGLFALGTVACGDDSEPAQGPNVQFDQVGADIVVDNRSDEALELELAAVVVCPDVRRTERIEVEAVRLDPNEMLMVSFDARLLDLTKFGNAGGCEVTPVAEGRHGSEQITLTGATIIFDSSGQRLNDPELNHTPDCTDGTRCTERL